ncbi:hypothetical protein DE146DRAFT_781054 [Phaeosphaeria sp. MPI-PUGE-AT-0046c]|nr:hypothetical protein DE146DRAFT_781054 [Phaeosphaeria sp. MPI-PUGE-AT-0046c]
MKLLVCLLALAFGPVSVLAELNAYEILMFYDMYRVDYGKDNTNFKIAKGCEDCNFEDFAIHIDRLGITSEVNGRFSDLKNPTLDEVEGWDGRNELVYDAKKLLGGLWRDEDTKSRPGHAIVIERLVNHMSSLRSSGDSDRLSRIVTGMQAAQLSRRSMQAKAMIDYINGRLSKSRLGSAKTQSISWTGGTFDEFDSMATLEGVQTTKRGAMRTELVAIAKSINNNKLESSSKRDVGIGSGRSLQKREFGEGLAIMALQRGIDTLSMPARKNC